MQIHLMLSFVKKKKIHLFYLEEITEVWGRVIEIVHLLVHSPNGSKDHSWALPKPAARRFSQVSHVGAELWANLHYFLRHVSKDLV